MTKTSTARLKWNYRIIIIHVRFICFEVRLFAFLPFFLEFFTHIKDLTLDTSSINRIVLFKVIFLVFLLTSAYLKSINSLKTLSFFRSFQSPPRKYAAALAKKVKAHQKFVLLRGWGYLTSDLKLLKSRKKVYLKYNSYIDAIELHSIII